MKFSEWQALSKEEQQRRWPKLTREQRVAIANEIDIPSTGSVDEAITAMKAQAASPTPAASWPPPPAPLPDPNAYTAPPMATICFGLGTLAVIGGIVCIAAEQTAAGTILIGSSLSVFACGSIIALLGRIEFNTRRRDDK